MNTEALQWGMGKGAVRKAKHHALRQQQRAELAEYLGKRSREYVNVETLTAMLKELWGWSPAQVIKIVRGEDKWAPVVNRVV